MKNTPQEELDEKYKRFVEEMEKLRQEWGLPEKVEYNTDEPDAMPVQVSIFLIVVIFFMILIFAGSPDLWDIILLKIKEI